MTVRLGANQYGKAENRVVRIYRDSPRHEIRDVNVSTCLRGDFSAAHLRGDQSDVLPTDTQKQTVYAYAKEKGLAEIEEYGLTLARHFVGDIGPVEAARIEIDEYAWQRVVVDGAEHDHTWIRSGQEVRTAAVTVDGAGEWVVGGLKDLVILKSTGSEFAGFLTDPYTVLEPTHDRVMATSLIAQWRFRSSTGIDWDTVYAGVKAQLVKQFAEVQSLALQQTLFEMGRAVLTHHPDIVEVRLAAPNKHHFAYDLTPFGLDNRNEVFHADDRPYGLIQATVTLDDAPPPGPAWDAQLRWL
jgi:urate oxidase